MSWVSFLWECVSGDVFSPAGNSLSNILLVADDNGDLAHPEWNEPSLPCHIRGSPLILLAERVYLRL